MVEMMMMFMLLNTPSLEPKEFQEPVVSVYSGGGGGDPDDDPTKKKRD